MSVGVASALDRDAILRQVEPPRRKIFELVRGIIDDLEVVAPWDLLYSPPEEGISGVAADLAGVIDRIPSRIAEQTAGLIAASEGEMRQALEEAEYFFFGIHGTVAPQLSRLQLLLQEPPPPGTGGSLSPVGDEINELTADLRGKYESSLIGAAATVVGRGRWRGAEIEKALFPEREQETRRSAQLVESLQRVIDAIRRLPDQLELAAMIARWRSGRRVDQYALVDFSGFRGQLGQLLKRDARRALYSGDYHQIRRREMRLGTRINELESVHQATWTGLSGEVVFQRLVALTLEIAAILHVELLEQLAGEELVDRLRRTMTDEQSEGSTRKNQMPAREHLPAEVRALPTLMLDEDLHTILGLLLGSVSNRACLAPLGEEVDPPDEPDQTQAESESPRPQEVVSAEVVVLKSLRAALADMQSDRNPHWNNLRMLDRMLKKSARIPPEMVKSAGPYLEGIQENLLPRLGAAVAIGAVPPWVRPKLLGYCQALSGDLGPERLAREVSDAMSRILRLLDALSTQTEEQIASREA